MNILIVGNGSIGIKNNSAFFINNHTGYFLAKIKEAHNVSFTQISTKYDVDYNLLNYDLKKGGISFKVLPHSKSLHFLTQALKLIKENNFIYLFYPGTLSKVLALLAIFLRKPYALYIRGQYYNQNALDRYILKNSKFILTVSPLFQKELQPLCSKVEVIKPMITIEAFDLNRNRRYTGKEKKNLLFVGRVEERKGINELIEIAKALKKNNKDFVFHIVGGGDLFSAVQRKIIECGLEREIILYGLISDKEQLKKIYEMADIFVFTSHDEGFPRVLYEAMASALPIFTTFVGGIPGRMNHLENCIEIPVKNYQKATDILLTYYDDDECLKNIGERGLETIEEIIHGSNLSHEEILLKQLERIEI